MGKQRTVSVFVEMKKLDIRDMKFHPIMYTVVPKSDVPKSDAFLKFSRNFLEILPEFVPKSDAF